MRSLPVFFLLPATSAVRAFFSPLTLGRMRNTRRPPSSHFDQSDSSLESESPVVICGPSGVGKGTLISALLNEFGEDINFAVSHTTREPRQGEEEGREYFYTTPEEMQDGIDAGEFIEHVEVHGNLYGTSMSSVKNVLSKGKVCLLDIDTQGVREVQLRAQQGDLEFKPHYIFIAPPSIEELRRRLTERGTETSEQIESRLETAKEEVAWACVGNGDVQAGAPEWDEVLVNEDFATTLAALRELVLRWHPHLATSTTASEDVDKGVFISSPGDDSDSGSMMRRDVPAR